MDIKLRPVTRADWNFILEVRNEPEVRMACHYTSVITAEEHEDYMNKLEADPEVYQWIITSGDADIGHVKIIHEEFGYMLRGGFRGKGLGVQFHNLAFGEARKLGLKRLNDTIKIDNQASFNLAIKTGFVFKGIKYKNGKPYAYVLEKQL